MKFGRWNVVGLSDKKSSDGRIMYDCICDCQMCKPESEREHRLVTAHNLKAGVSKSCGCSKKYNTLASNIRKKPNMYRLSEDKSYYIGTTHSGYEFYFSVEDYPLISKYCWHKHQDGYLRTLYTYYYDDDNIRHNHYILMHRLLIGENNIPVKMEIDHINGKPNDNRRTNLRLITHANNMKNQSLHKDNTSGYAGVSPNFGWGKPWTAEFTADGVMHYLGHFDTKEEAAQAISIERAKIVGDFARASSDLFNGTRRC